MYLQIEAYRGDDWIFDSQIKVSENLDKKLYRFFKKTTIVFISQDVYDKLNTNVRDRLPLALGDDDALLKQMLNKNILVIVYDNQLDPYSDVMLFIDNYTNKENEYLIIEEIV